MRPEDMLDLPPMAEKPPGLNYKLADISDPSRISVTKIRWNMRTTNWLAGFFEVTKKHHHLFPYTKTSIFLTSASSGTERSCHALLVSATSSKTVAASKPAPWHFFVGERNWGQGGFARPEVQQFAHWKWMVGKRGFPFGIYPYFQVQTVRSVSFRESNWRVIFFLEGWMREHLSPLFRFRILLLGHLEGGTTPGFGDLVTIVVTMVKLAGNPPSSNRKYISIVLCWFTRV